jgi:tyrosyl-tRNA synthetase
MPTTALNFDGDEILLIDVLVETKLCASRGEAKKLIQQGGVSVEEEKVSDLGYKFTKEALKDGIKIKKGKKIYHKITV